MALDRGECLLRDIRLKTGMTQDDLSVQLEKRFGIEVSAKMIGHYERNRKPIKLEVLRALAVIFRKHMDDFYTWPVT